MPNPASLAAPSPLPSREDLLMPLWRFALAEALRCGADPADAEDVASTTIERYLRAAVVLAPFAWARILVVRRVARLRLRQSRQGSLPESQPPVPHLRWERSRDLARVLARLPERDRRLLELAASGASHAEIGSRTGLATGRVGAYLVRAVEKASRVANGGPARLRRARLGSAR